MDDSLDVSFENMQIQPYQFEPLVLGHSNSDENSSESDSASEEENGDVNIERIGQVDWWAFELCYTLVDNEALIQ